MHKLSFPIFGLPLVAVLAACAPKAPETAAPLAPQAVPAPVARPVMGSGQD
ncbi:MAG: protease, partial [Rhodobacteraceae bacterium]|nr:protease [Paracoccaceae bacterium]